MKMGLSSLSSLLFALISFSALLNASIACLAAAYPSVIEFSRLLWFHLKLMCPGT